MAKGRHTKSVGIDGRRCIKCDKLAKDKINGEYFCRIHSPVREGYRNFQEKNSRRKK